MIQHIMEESPNGTFDLLNLRNLSTQNKSCLLFHTIGAYVDYNRLYQGK